MTVFVTHHKGLGCGSVVQCFLSLSKTLYLVFSNTRAPPLPKAEGQLKGVQVPMWGSKQALQ